MMTFTVRSARPADAAGMTRVHVEGWRQTYRGLMADEILDAPDFVDRRERFWTAALGERRAHTGRTCGSLTWPSTVTRSTPRAASTSRELRTQASIKRSPSAVSLLVVSAVRHGGVES
ncbi:hypothetical protein [Microbacterium hominis]|uniref:hypothetical protein n=1 Tax=Microbacterium hominis TaxID=162426 RepID=UPI001E3F462D|nr:hypothetical protein [Microbacterium hominis]